jgi:HSP20 family protein
VSPSLFSPPVEIFERDGQLVVRADLPGLTKDDVHVEVTDEALTIEGERRYGTFRRQIPLPEGVNADQVIASFKDGVLEVSRPAPQQQARGRRIDIQSGPPSPSGTPSSAGHQASGSANQEHTRATAGGA